MSLKMIIIVFWGFLKQGNTVVQLSVGNGTVGIGYLNNGPPKVREGKKYNIRNQTLRYFLGSGHYW